MVTTISKPRICFWNYSDNDCVYMTQLLIHSLRKHGIQHDFICLADRNVKGATRTVVMPAITQELRKGWLFKLTMLLTISEFKEYDYFLWLDSDSLCVAPLTFNLVELCRFSPLHCFLETDMSGIPGGLWFDIETQDLIKLFRVNGVNAPIIYTLNGGFYMIERRFIDTFLCLVKQFIGSCNTAAIPFASDEMALIYVMHLVSRNLEYHRIINRRNIWMHDMHYKLGKLPEPGMQWNYVDFFNGWSIPMKPSIVHLLQDKQMLIDVGKLI